MRQALAGLLLFILGVVVGTAGSDDSLLQQARHREDTAYDRGHAAATAEMQAVAVGWGYAKWIMNPETGEPDRFVWRLDHSHADTEALLPGVAGLPELKTRHFARFTSLSP